MTSITTGCGSRHAVDHQSAEARPRKHDPAVEEAAQAAGLGAVADGDPQAVGPRRAGRGGPHPEGGLVGHQVVRQDRHRVEQGRHLGRFGLHRPPVDRVLSAGGGRVGGLAQGLDRDAGQRRRRRRLDQGEAAAAFEGLAQGEGQAVGAGAVGAEHAEEGEAGPQANVDLDGLAVGEQEPGGEHAARALGHHHVVLAGRQGQLRAAGAGHVGGGRLAVDQDLGAGRELVEVELAAFRLEHDRRHRVVDQLVERQVGAVGAEARLFDLELVAAGASPAITISAENSSLR